MNRLPFVPDSELDPVAREALAAAARELGAAPAPLRALAAAPHVLSAFWRLAETVLLEGSVPRTTKALVALAATAASPGAESLSGAFREALFALGVDRLVLEDLERRGESARLPERTQRVLGFARRAALQPALLTDEDWKVLRREGLGDGELAELVGLGAGLAGLIALARAMAAKDA